MWPFRRRTTSNKEEENNSSTGKKKSKRFGKVVAGVVFGAAIASIIGKKMLDKHEKEHDGEIWE